MYWRTRFDAHIGAAKFWQKTGMLKDEHKEKHPKLYKFADQQWRYHAQKALGILKQKVS